VTSRFGTLTTSLAAGSTARAEQVNTAFAASDAALVLVATELNRSFRFSDGADPGVSWANLPQSAVQRAQKTLGFDSAGAPTLLGQTFVWRGSWVTATSYSVSDVVKQGADGSLYLCLVGHTSGTFATDLAANRWVLMVDLSTVGQFIRRFQIITGNYTAVAGDDLFVDVTAGPITITLPASPLISDQPISVCHIAGNISTNNITIARNAKVFMGGTADMTVSTTNASFELAYSDTANGWRLVKGT
jgi:hypothetical protein